MPTASDLFFQKTTAPSGVSATGTLDYSTMLKQTLAPTLHALFDAVQPAEAAAGSVDYRLMFIGNSNISEDFIALKAYISSQTTSPSTSLEIGLAVKTSDTVFEAITADTTAPTDVTFTAAANLAGAVVIGDLPHNSGTPEYIGTNIIGLWLKRTITAGAPPLASDASVLTITNAA